MPTRSKWQHLATEAVNPRSRDIDTMTADEIVEVMILDNRNVLAAVQREKARIARAAVLVAGAVLKGGRLIFAGAGTSGRLGVLEAAELPPNSASIRRWRTRLWPAASVRSSEQRKESKMTTTKATGRCVV